MSAKFEGKVVLVAGGTGDWAARVSLASWKKGARLSSRIENRKNSMP